MPKPNTADAMKRYKSGNAGFTDKAHLKAKGLIPRADGTKKKSPKYEEAPVNATGTAVAGTGDDSSTVIVKKRKDMRDRLFKRFKIKETIDRLIPDLEYAKDEITERKNQLKAMALQVPSINVNDKSNIQANPVEDLDKDDAKTIKPIIKQLKKSVTTHNTQAKQLQKDISDEYVDEGLTGAAAGAVLGGLTAGVPGAAAGAYLGHKIQQAAKKNKKPKKEDMDAQPQDKDVKKVKGTQPKKYYKTLDKGTKKKRADFFKNRPDYNKSDDDDDYKAAPGDKKAKTKPSTFTKKFKQMYGEDMSLDEAIKGLQNKAKKTGMPYSILKQVYNRGMAAWKGGHRPGTTQQQWAFARVNSFVTKSSGTWGGADKDLAAKVRGSKK